MPKLQFLNPELRPGLNVTVRNGQKWLTEASPGDELEVVETGKEDDVIAVARHVQSVEYRAADLPEYLLTFEHDPSCRTLAGLRKAMDRAYGEWGPMVTVVLFYVDEPPCTS